MPTEGLTIELLATVGGVAAATTLLSQLFWSTIGSAGETKARFGPIVAVGIGTVVGIVAGALLGFGGREFAQTVINGVVGGFASAGLYDVLKSKAGITA